MIDNEGEAHRLENMQQERLPNDEPDQVDNRRHVDDGDDDNEEDGRDQQGMDERQEPPRDRQEFLRRRLEELHRERPNEFPQPNPNLFRNAQIGNPLLRPPIPIPGAGMMRMPPPHLFPGQMNNLPGFNQFGGINQNLNGIMGMPARRPQHEIDAMDLEQGDLEGERLG